MKRIECVVTGRVQMVMFRDFTKRNARKLKLAGIVENKVDGSVYVVAEGHEEALEKLISLLYQGPILAHVDHVDCTWGEATGDYKEFNIKY